MNRLTYAVGYAIGFAIGLTRVMLGLSPRHPLVDPPLPCGECDLETDTCPCLENLSDATALYLRKYGLEGYTTDQLYRDIAALEESQR